MAKIPKPSLAETHPEVAAQADGWDPTTLTSGSSIKVGWKCGFGHSWNAVVASRSKGNGCPVCSNNQVLVGFNDLATTHPELAAQADGWDPNSIFARSSRKLGWVCASGHRWITSPYKRSVRSQGCPYCSGLLLIIGQTDLVTTHPDIAAQADGWDPTTIKAGSGKKLAWKGTCGHKWTAVVSSRALKKVGCPICTNKQVLIGFNDLASTSPELAMEADGWNPNSVTISSGKKLGWKCKLGHQWRAVVAMRTYGQGCPVCANKDVSIGFNDLATTHPELAMEADGWDPTTVVAGSHKKLAWEGKCGHKWEAVVMSRSRNNAGCAVCENLKLLIGHNDLRTRRPDLATQAIGWDPSTVIVGAASKKRWRCEQGHEWVTTVSKRMSGQGCPTCAKYGFDPNQPGFLYFIDHFELDMFQVGITNHPEERLGKHGGRGWEILEIRGPMDGHLTRKLESDCLHALEKRGAILGHKARVKKFDGYSEAWTKASLNVTSIKQILDWVYEDESK
jgi:hypothetical protein